MRPLLLALVVGMVIAAPAQADIGYGQIGTNQDGNQPGRAQSYGFVARAGEVDRLSVHVHPNNQARRIVLGLYSDWAGRPGRLLRSCTVDNAAGGELGVWNRCFIPAFVPIEGRR